jgi:hypothetical protein
MIGELDLKKSYVLEYLREQVSKLADENQSVIFDVNQKDFEESKLHSRYKDNEPRDIIKQLCTGNELGVVLDLLTDETHGEFKLQKVSPTKKKDTFEPVNDPAIDEMINGATSRVAKELGTVTHKDKTETKHFFNQPRTQWGSEYNSWTVEYHPENAGKPRTVSSEFNPNNFYITKDRELVQILPEIKQRKIKLSPNEHKFLLELSYNQPAYTLATDIASRISADTKSVRNMAQSLRKEITTNFIGIKGDEFIESENGYRLAKKINLKEM